MPGRSYTGTTSTLYHYPGSKHIGEVQAWNVDTGKRAWTHTFAKSANWGPILTTAGGLVFSGGTNDRMFRAFDAKSGKVLWETPRTRALSASRCRSRLTAGNTSPFSRASASTAGRCRRG